MPKRSIYKHINPRTYRRRTRAVLNDYLTQIETSNDHDFFDSVPIDPMIANETENSTSTAPSRRQVLEEPPAATSNLSELDTNYQSNNGNDMLSEFTADVGHVDIASAAQVDDDLDSLSFTEDMLENDCDCSSFSFTENLQQWAIEHRITHSALNDLLKLLKSNGHTELPLDARTILKTPKILGTINPVDPGSYWHFGIEKAITYLYSNDWPEEFTMFFNIDGLPISSSSRSQFWPILC